MKVLVANHPLITHKLTVLRNKETNSQVFRHLVEELVTLLAYEATRDVKINPVDIVTPVAPMKGAMLSTPRPSCCPNPSRGPRNARGNDARASER